MAFGVLRKMIGALALLAGFAGSIAVAQPASPGYRLGPDDAIQVVIYGQPEAGITTRVKADGTIVMPFIGKVDVDGLTNIALAELITERMVAGGFLRQPVVNVEVTQYVSRSVNVAGRVSSPGIIPLDRPYRALEVLLKSGWIRENGATYVYLRRRGQAEVQLAVEDLVRGSGDKDPLLQPGDTIFVPDADNFFIYGQINRPGSFPILPGMTVRQALAIAGGATATGSVNKVGLLRGNAKEVDADLADIVRKNDVFVVKERLF
ncbi:hypothetical protein GCM10007973_24240 [Polymorphobacter multimanifer]|uniref:Polysaccharide export outer membrane protein n=2 Tax=Polymorphobacter multimanifer TaxID=1070431 RepID=A0A841L0K3_9SPHN|nr:polysaccharide biosynthesis/export family protein [Polymorphobacter multimanifer]MBB6225866.1 polysaccharide export outer membrane protein [Polymorphobacter multimanifer]GGI86964.1 hypothetical protein GCM10007973_24240 [Polymorphobacter multimanifer]